MAGYPVGYQPRVLGELPPSSPPVPYPPVRPPGLGDTPVQQDQTQTQIGPQGQFTLWDALRALFSGGAPSAQGQGMSGLIQPRGQAGAGTDMLGNPTGRFR